MNRFISCLFLAFTGIASVSHADIKEIASTGVKKSCCSSGCPDIVPCPPSEVIERKTCDATIQVYEVEGFFNYWSEFMRAPRQVCAYDIDQFDAMVFAPDTKFDRVTQEYTHLKKVVVYPWWVQNITTAKEIAHQADWHNRRFKARGCYVNDGHFMVEWIDFAVTQKNP